MKKISIMGTGNRGSGIAQRATEEGLSVVMMYIKPVYDGSALGGGFELALSSDVIVATQKRLLDFLKQGKDAPI